MTDTRPPAAPSEQEQAPYLDGQPPPWAARGLASILLLIFAAAVVAAVVVQVPETVTAPFVLVPVRGADPIRAFREGIVADVRVTDAQTVDAGAVLFSLSSQPIGDRAAEWQGLEPQIRGATERLTLGTRKYESQQRADEEQTRQLRAKIALLTRSLDLKREQVKLSSEIADRQKRSFDEGLVSWIEKTRPDLDVARLADEVQQAETEIEDARGAIARLQYEAQTRQAEFRELQRATNEELDRARIRKLALDKDLVHSGNRLDATAPCAGTIVRLAIRGAGAIVHEGDLLAEIACTGERLQAELSIPQSRLALVRPGQAVKLLYDAFPYERYGVRSATIRWISPSNTSDRDAKGFRALAETPDAAVLVKGQPQALVPGMGGRAEIIVGRRALASYAFEPIRQLRENLAPARPASPPP